MRFSRGTPPLHPLLLSYAALRCRYTVPSFPWHRPGHRPLLSFAGPGAGSAPSEFVPFVGSPALCRRVAVASPSRAGHRAVRRAAADVAAVVVDRGGQRPDPRALPPAVRRRGVAVVVARVLPAIGARATAVVRGTWRRKRTRRPRRPAAVPFAGSSRGVPSRRRPRGRSRCAPCCGCRHRRRCRPRRSATGPSCPPSGAASSRRGRHRRAGSCPRSARDGVGHGPGFY